MKKWLSFIFMNGLLARQKDKLEGIDIEAEYALIRQKKSRLPRIEQKEFEMSDEELRCIKNASKQIHKFWKEMGTKYGFIWDSVKASPKGEKFFVALGKKEKGDKGNE